MAATQQPGDTVTATMHYQLFMVAGEWAARIAEESAT